MRPGYGRAGCESLRGRSPGVSTLARTLGTRTREVRHEMRMRTGRGGDPHTAPVRPASLSRPFRASVRGSRVGSCPRRPRRPSADGSTGNVDTPGSGARSCKTWLCPSGTTDGTPLHRPSGVDPLRRTGGPCPRPRLRAASVRHLFSPREGPGPDGGSQLRLLRGEPPGRSLGVFLGRTHGHWTKLGNKT